jgi:hypothetical protein
MLNRKTLTMRIFVCIIALLLTLPLIAQRSKNKTEEVSAVAVSEGISYALPRTGIRIIIEARKTTHIPGPFAMFADPLLGIKDVFTLPQSVWEMKSISFESFAEPDPSQVFKTNAMIIPYVQLTSDGCLAGFNSPFQDKREVKPIFNSLVFAGNGASSSFVNGVLSSTSSGRTPVEQRAQEAATQVLKIRAARFDIVAGLLDEHHPDGKAYEESLDELRKSEKELLELFTGRQQSGEYTFNFIYIPVSKSVKGEVIFRFDENLGFLAKNDFSGKPVMLDMDAEELPSGASGMTSPANPGLFYRQPGIGNIKLTKELTVIGTARLAIAQFGNVQSLPSELLNGSYCIEFNTVTGAIKSISKK